MGTCHRPNRKQAARATLLLLYLIAAAPSVFAAATVSGGSHDFGFVPVDFKVTHNFLYVNTTTRPVGLKTHVVACDCSTVRISDTLVQPGDTSRIRLEFDTYNLFGPTVKSFTITTTDPKTPVIEYVYTSNIGQWIFGLRPEPISAFFLPVNKSKKMTIPNQGLKSVTVSLEDRADAYYEVKLVKATAAKGESIELEVVPAQSMAAGTYLSSFRLKAEPGEGKGAFFLTVPVKIVRY